MRRKRLILVAATIAILASLFGVFRLEQQIALRAAARNSKEERIREIDGQLRDINRAKIRLYNARQNGMPDTDAAQRQGIAEEQARLLKERDALKTELSESAVLPSFRHLFR
jgi:hypothetical protein